MGYEDGSKDRLRKKAENIVNTSKNLMIEEIRNLTQEDIYELLHELRVHQSELEIQNEELQKKQLSIEISRLRYFDLYNLAPVGYLTLSEDGVVNEANIKAAFLLDASRNEVLNCNITDFIDRENQDTFYFKNRELFKTEKSQSYELYMRTQKNRSFWAHVNACIETDVMSGRKCHLVFTDVTKIKEAEASLISAKQLAEASELAKTQFLENMSHEIRTPLNGIMLTIQLLQMTSQTDEQKEYTRLFKDSCERLLVTINDILDFSKIDVGKMRLEQIPFKMSDVFEDVKKVFRTESETKGVSLNLEVGSDVPDDLIGDPFRLKQIITNLVGNAVKFTDVGSVNGTLNLVEEHEDKIKLEMSVKDTGIGIEKRDILNVFDKFVQTDKKDSCLYGGSGLGLAISKGLIQEMGGEIWVESDIGEGSQFYFTCILKKES